MAGPASDYHRGDMDITEQTATYHLIMGFTKWGSLYIAAGILALVIWFCVPTGGFFAGLISAVVLIVLGTLVLREKKSAH